MAASTELFNPTSPDFIADPYPVYRRLRETEPVHWFEPLSSWVVSRYQDCHHILRNPSVFRSPEGLTGIQAVDPPESAGYRSLIRAGLRTAERPEFGEELARTARQIISLAPAGPFDLVSAFINPFCLASVCRLVAQPEPEVNLLEVYTKAHQVAMDSEVIEATLRESVEARAAESRALVAGLIDAWYTSESPGLISHLRDGRDRLGITAETELATIKFLIFSTYGTGTAALGNALVALLRRPWAISELRRAAESSWDVAIDELLRYDPPVQVLVRTSAKDIELSGVPVREGQDVLVMAGSANHDPDEFEEPEDVVLTREHNPHLGLGWGAHVCLGAALTRLMFRAVLRALLEVPDLGLVGEPKRRQIATSRAFEEIPVERR
jgi:cytochrome P450